MKKLFMAIAATLAMTALQGAEAQVCYTPTATTFSTITLSKAQAVKLRIYNEGMGGSPVKTVALRRCAADKNGYPTWNAQVEGDLSGKFYTLDVKYNGKWGGECAGLAAQAVGVNGHRGAIIDMAATNPEGWSDDRMPAIDARDIVLYEMHHRDFSIDPSSELKYKGKFLALTEPRAIEHLTSLGVNAVHLLPSFDYASIDETQLHNNHYNWGYDPLNYNVPEGGYSTNPYDPATRIREFKLMVQALHKAGIKVILDVVYNHTMSIGESNFQRIMPDEFYRKTPQGEYSNGSGCSNETASERPVMRDYMIESVRYWVNEYHIDGFRFDLMGIHDIPTMNAIRAALPPHIFIYGEGWSAGECAHAADQLAMKAVTHKMPGIGAFCDDMRDALRGPFNDDHQAAFLAGKPGHEESIKLGIVGAINHPQVDYSKVNYSKSAWTQQPTQMISYVSCHDDMCLVDRLLTSIPGITTDELIRLDLLAQTAVFTSQGVPFMLSGEEMLRNKKGVHNSYCSPDSVNQLNWTNLETYPQVFAYYKNLIALRHNHRAFHMGDAGLVTRMLEFLPSQDALVAFHIKAGVPGEPWNDIYVVLNGSKQVRTIDVPQGNYTVVCRNITINENGLGTVSGPIVEVPAQSALIFHN